MRRIPLSGITRWGRSNRSPDTGPWPNSASTRSPSVRNDCGRPPRPNANQPDGGIRVGGNRNPGKPRQATRHRLRQRPGLPRRRRPPAGHRPVSPASRRLPKCPRASTLDLGRRSRQRYPCSLGEHGRRIVDLGTPRDSESRHHAAGSQRDEREHEPDDREPNHRERRTGFRDSRSCHGVRHQLHPPACTGDQLGPRPRHRPTTVLRKQAPHCADERCREVSTCLHSHLQGGAESMPDTPDIHRSTLM